MPTAIQPMHLQQQSCAKSLYMHKKIKIDAKRIEIYSYAEQEL